MNKIYVPLGIQHKIEDDNTLDILRKIKADRAFVTPVCRIPFEKCEKRTEIIERMKEQISFLNNNGISAAAWICSLGYGGEVECFNKKAAENFTRRIGIDGSSCDDAFCPTDKNFTDAMCSIIKDVASTGADMIMLDDELTMTAVSSLGCVCDEHMRIFNEKVGGNFCSSDIPKLVFTGKPNKYRDAWLDTMGKSLTDFCKSLRIALDEVNPKIRMGFASGFTSWDIDGVDAVELSKILAGNTKPFLRLTGAPYWFSANRFGKQPLSNILETCRQQYSWCRTKGEDIDLFTEADTYPRSRFYTPAVISEAFNIGTKLSDSCDVLKYFTDYISWYDDGYINAHMRNSHIYKDISKHFDNKKPVGIRVYSDMQTIRNAKLPDTFHDPNDILNRWYKHTPIIPVVNAIPTVYDGDEYCAMAFGENARGLDNDALKNGMIIDLSAAEILQEKGIDVGLGEMTPVKVYQECFDKYNLVFNYYCDKGSYKITTDERAVILSRFIGNGFESPGSYLYENDNHQRFLVYAFNVYETLLHSGYQLCHGRGQQLNDAIEWLCGKRLPAECNDVPKLYCICKEDERTISLGYLACSEDEIFDANIKINVPFNSRNIKFINCTGCVHGDNITVDYIKGFGFAGIEIEKISK